MPKPVSSWSEDKKVNLFYLRDVLLKAENSSHHVLEKIGALAKLKRNSHLQVFKFSIEPLLLKESFSN